MSPIIKGGVALGIVTILISLVFGFTGMYKDPSLANFWFPMAIGGTALVLFWTLRQTAATRGYGGQIVAALGIAIVAAPIILGNGFLFNGVLFPDSMEIARQNAADGMAASGLSDADVEKQLDALGFMFTPAFSAILGAVMTVVTSLVLGLIIAIFVRKKD